MPTDLEQSIFRTVAFFSLFEYPLTAFEVWKWLLRPAAPYSIDQVLGVLETSAWVRDRLEAHQGFFVLRGQEGLVHVRHDRFLDATRKYRRLRRAATYLRLLPTVQSVAACNTLAWSNTKPESDIDLFIVTKPRRVWVTRFLSVLPFALLRLRPAPGAHDPLCFSFFADEERLDLRPLRISHDDPYLAQWVQTLVPIIDQKTPRTMSAANGWARGLFPNSFSTMPAWPRRFQTPFRSRALSFLLGPFESLARRFQRPRFPEDIQTLANKDTRVIIDDGMLKFHPNDRRAEFVQKLAGILSRV